MVAGFDFDVVCFKAIGSLVVWGASYDKGDDFVAI